MDLVTILSHQSRQQKKRFWLDNRKKLNNMTWKDFNRATKPVKKQIKPNE